MKAQELVSSILEVAEKAANLARCIRSEETLFQLLVEEKTGESKNKRFVQDFKTLADVLVQETVKQQLGAKFPGMVGNVHGEEDNKFTNASGEHLVVEIKPTLEETAQLLATVLEGNTRAANLLAKVVHQDVTMVTGGNNLEALGDLEMSASDIAVWVDPIDSTAQYISGTDGDLGPHNVFSSGLPCVLVLIGVYHQKTGKAILGVTNQPFCVLDPATKQWSGRALWGVAHNEVKVNNLPQSQGGATTEPVVVMSESEDEAVKAKIQKAYKGVFAAGAGYKVLCAVDRLVTAYLLTHGSTFKWDTCSPHAILLSMSGGIVDFEKAFDLVKQHADKEVADLVKMMEECQLGYNQPDSPSLSGGQEWLNSRGLVAYTDAAELVGILKCLMSQ